MTSSLLPNETILKTVFPSFDLKLTAEKFLSVSETKDISACNGAVSVVANYKTPFTEVQSPLGIVAGIHRQDIDAQHQLVRITTASIPGPETTEKGFLGVVSLKDSQLVVEDVVPFTNGIEEFEIHEIPNVIFFVEPFKKDERDLANFLQTEWGFVTGLLRYEDQPLTLEKFQISFLKDRTQFRWVTKGRQVGFSFLFALEALARCHLRKEHSSVFISYAQDEAKEIQNPG